MSIATRETASYTSQKAPIRPTTTLSTTGTTWGCTSGSRSWGIGRTGFTSSTATTTEAPVSTLRTTADDTTPAADIPPADRTPEATRVAEMARETMAALTTRATLVSTTRAVTTVPYDAAVEGMVVATVPYDAAAEGMVVATVPYDTAAVGIAVAAGAGGTGAGATAAADTGVVGTAVAIVAVGTAEATELRTQDRRQGPSSGGSGRGMRSSTGDNRPRSVLEYPDLRSQADAVRGAATSACGRHLIEAAAESLHLAAIRPHRPAYAADPWEPAREMVERMSSFSRV